MLGFALVSVPVRLSFLLDETYGYFDAYKRGWVLSLDLPARAARDPVRGPVWATGCSAATPERRVRIFGVLVIGLRLLPHRSALRFSRDRAFIVLFAIANACQVAAFTQIGPTISAVVPYRMRAQAFAMVGVYIFLMGGFFGGLLAGAFSDACGERTALTIIVPPAALLGGLLIMYGAVVHEGRHLARRPGAARGTGGAATAWRPTPSTSPCCRCATSTPATARSRCCSTSSSRCSAARSLALLGTNGAGKSTLLGPSAG